MVYQSTLDTFGVKYTKLGKPMSSTYTPVSINCIPGIKINPQ